MMVQKTQEIYAKDFALVRLIELTALRDMIKGYYLIVQEMPWTARDKSLIEALISKTASAEYIEN